MDQFLSFETYIYSSIKIEYESIELSHIQKPALYGSFCGGWTCLTHNGWETYVELAYVCMIIIIIGITFFLV